VWRREKKKRKKGNELSTIEVEKELEAGRKVWLIRRLVGARSVVTASLDHLPLPTLLAYLPVL
jgi:hypothetical protein